MNMTCKSGGIKVVGLGLATVDVLIRFDHLPVWDERIWADQFGLEGGGMSATGVVAAARMGVPAGFIGTCGNDFIGNFKLRSLSDRGVDTSRVKQRDCPEGSIVMVFINKDGERMFCGVRGGKQAGLRPEELDREYITSADYLLIDGIEAQAAAVAAKWMKEAGKTVILDGWKTLTHLSPQFPGLVPHVDYLICGSGFVPALTGETDLIAAGRAALKLGPRVVVQTEGADGSYTVTADGEEFHTPAFPIQVVDTTGAGDVFHGAYIAGLVHGWDLKKIATFSSAASAIKCTRLGGRAGIPTIDETLAFLRDRGITLK
jgi:sulfofructose kinase